MKALINGEKTVSGAIELSLAIGPLLLVPEMQLTASLMLHWTMSYVMMTPYTCSDWHDTGCMQSGRAGQGRAGQGRAGQGRAGQGRLT